jgi:hypothetical protein
MGVRNNKGICVEKAYPGAAIFAPNSLVSFALDVNALIEEISIQLTGSLTLAGYTANPLKRVEALENLISQVSFNATAKQNGAQAVEVSSVDAAYLAYKTNLVAGAAPIRQDVGVTNGVYLFETNFTKYFGAKGINKLYDATYLDTRLLQSLTLQLQTRDVGAMIVPGSGTAGTATLGATQAIVHSREWQGGAIAASAPYVKETQRSFDLTNLAGLDQQFRNVPIGNILQRQTFKTTVSPDVNYGDPNNGIIATAQRVEGAHVKTSVTGAGGTAVPNDIVYKMLQSQDKTDFKQATWPTGYATVEYSRTGNISDCLNLTNALSCMNLADITVTAGQINTLWITDEQIVSN